MSYYTPRTRVIWVQRCVENIFIQRIYHKFYLFFFSVLLVYSIVSQPRWWTHHVKCICTCHKRNSIHERNSWAIKRKSIGDCPHKEKSPLPQSVFFMPCESEMLAKLLKFQNSFTQLLRLSLPATLSIAFCPLALFFHGPIVEFMWPYAEFMTAPNINDALACYLVPAGLVYAIAFGFAYQEAISNQNRLVEKLTSVFVVMEQMVLLCSCSGLERRETSDCLLFLKEETISWIDNITGLGMDCYKFNRRTGEFDTLILQDFTWCTVYIVFHLSLIFFLFG